MNFEFHRGLLLMYENEHFLLNDNLLKNCLLGFHLCFLNGYFLEIFDYYFDNYDIIGNKDFLELDSNIIDYFFL